MDGNLKSAKVYMLVVFSATCFTFQWFGKIGEETLLAMEMPTMVAWLAAHVTQQVNKMRNGSSDG